MDIFAPVQIVADKLIEGLGLDPASYIASSLNFFFYDTVKIGILLVAINFFMAAVRYYFPMEKARRFLSTRRLYGLDYIFAALLGVVTPFCSCSSIPLFIGFLGAGIPLGVTFAFLISSPLVNESSLYLFPAMFGWRITIIYNLLGLTIAVLGGILIEKLNLYKYVRSEILKSRSKNELKLDNGSTVLSVREQLIYFWQEGIAITKSVLPYVIFGVGIGALIHGFIPASLIEQYLASRSWWSVPLATLLGVPLYANSVGVIPIMQVMVEKGVPLGTAIAFMTGVVTLSIPQTLILNRVVRWQLLVWFFGITIVGIMIMGYIFNYIA